MSDLDSILLSSLYCLAEIINCLLKLSSVSVWGRKKTSGSVEVMKYEFGTWEEKSEKTSVRTVSEVLWYYPSFAFSCSWSTTLSIFYPFFLFLLYLFKYICLLHPRITSNIYFTLKLINLSWFSPILSWLRPVFRYMCHMLTFTTCNGKTNSTNMITFKAEQ